MKTLPMQTESYQRISSEETGRWHKTCNSSQSKHFKNQVPTDKVSSKSLNVGEFLTMLDSGMHDPAQKMNNASKRILIIDDDPQINLMVAEFLHRSGYSVWHCTNGEKGLQICDTFKPNLVICDLDMPIMDGWTMISRLRENETHADIPVIFLSACRDRSKIRQSINLGGDDFLSKPLDMNEIIQAIEARLSRKQKEKQRVARKMRTAIEVFAGIINDAGGKETELHWLAETVRPGGIQSAPLNRNEMTIEAGAPTNKSNYFMAKVNNRQQFVKLTEVKAFTAYGEYSQAYWGNNQKMLFRKPLKQWIKELPPEIFVRIHRQSIVNLKFLSFVEKSNEGKPQIHLKDFHTPLPISQRCTPRLNKLLKQFQPQT